MLAEFEVIDWIFGVVEAGLHSGAMPLEVLIEGAKLMVLKREYGNVFGRLDQTYHSDDSSCSSSSVGELRQAEQTAGG